MNQDSHSLDKKNFVFFQVLHQIEKLIYVKINLFLKMIDGSLLFHYWCILKLSPHFNRFIFAGIFR